MTTSEFPMRTNSGLMPQQSSLFSTGLSVMRMKTVKPIGGKRTLKYEATGDIYVCIGRAPGKPGISIPSE